MKDLRNLEVFIFYIPFPGKYEHRQYLTMGALDYPNKLSLFVLCHLLSVLLVLHCIWLVSIFLIANGIESSFQ